MPIYIDISNFIIPKSVVEARYNGGIDSFRDRFININNPRNQEDDELFQIAIMNPDDFNFQHFESEGLFLKKGDYDIVNKYGYEENVEWLKIKFPFIYHSNCKPIQVQLVNHLASMTMDVIMKEVEKGFCLSEEINKTTITENKYYKKLIAQKFKLKKTTNTEGNENELNPLEQFIKNKINLNNLSFDSIAKKMQTKKILKKGDNVIFYIPNRIHLTNKIIFTKTKLIIGNFDSWDSIFEIKYEDFLIYRIYQKKFLFRKTDLIMTLFDNPFGSPDIWVNRNFSEEFKALFCKILQIYYPELYDEYTNWDKFFIAK